jgi:hypothetical protein
MRSERGVDLRPRLDGEKLQIRWRLRCAKGCFSKRRLRVPFNLDASSHTFRSCQRIRKAAYLHCHYNPSGSSVRELINCSNVGAKNTMYRSGS